MIAALAVLPLLYVIPATMPLWLRHRYLLLGVQAALTYLPSPYSARTGRRRGGWRGWSC